MTQDKNHKEFVVEFIETISQTNPSLANEIYQYINYRDVLKSWEQIALYKNLFPNIVNDDMASDEVVNSVSDKFKGVLYDEEGYVKFINLGQITDEEWKERLKKEQSIQDLIIKHKELKNHYDELELEYLKLTKTCEFYLSKLDMFYNEGWKIKPNVIILPEKQ